MSSKLVQIALSMPSAMIVSLSAILILLVLGWLISIIAGLRSEQGQGLRLLLMFPITNPFALFVLLLRDWKGGMLPAVCYLLALGAYPLGGAMAERIERIRLEAYEQGLIDSGETLSVQSLIVEPVSPQSNIWAHPFLAPLGVAGQGTTEGQAARTTARYASMRLPPADPKIKYVDEGTTIHARFLREFHLRALSIVSARDGVINESNTPQTWNDCGEIVVTYFKKAEDDFAQLEEALKRPYDQYPYAWNDGVGMMAPHLAKLREFTRSATMRSTAFSAMAGSSASFRDAQLAMGLIHTGDADWIMSRLLQMAQVMITLDTLRAAQQFHVWNGEEWSEVQARLREIDFPALIPAALRVDRIIATRVDGKNLYELSLSRQDGLNLFAPAIGAKLRRLWLVGSTDLILATETALEKSRTQPWRDCNVAPLPRSLEGYEYGLLGRMLLGAQGTVFQKALRTQSQIELALVACALERYYLSNQQYPRTLRELVPDYLDPGPRDPMNHEPWHYRRGGERGFRLYTVGENGRDHDGEFEEHKVKNDALGKDDFLWSVQAVVPSLPQFEYDASSSSTPNKFRIDPEMMRRYGLKPSNQG